MREREEWLINAEGPNYLYHFTTLDSLIKISLTDSFKISNLSAMNDKNEALPIFHKPLPDFSKTVQNRYSFEFLEIAKKEAACRKRVFIGCFTLLDSDQEVYEKDALWGYYGDSAKGVCIKINKREFQKLIYERMVDEEYEAVIADDIYAEKFSITYENLTSFNEMKQNYRNHPERFSDHLLEPYMFSYFFRRKSIDWAHEKEFRYFFYDNSWTGRRHILIENFNKTIVDVFIGVNCSISSLSMCLNIKEKLLPDVDFWVLDEHGNKTLLDKDLLSLYT